jgi:hypothetical protein
VVTLHPNFAWSVWRTRACAELVLDGPRRAAVRSAVLARAKTLGHRLGCEAELLVVADGLESHAEIEGSNWRVRVPACTRRIGLVSRTWVPCEVLPDADDARVLGVAVRDMRLDGRVIALDDARLSGGWHAPEGGWRWTDGDAGVLLAGERTLEFTLVLTGNYWVRHPQYERGATGRCNDEGCAPPHRMDSSGDTPNGTRARWSRSAPASASRSR